MFNVVLMFVAFFGVFILSGLFAFLVATRKWHWFVRAAILIVSVLPFLIVEANDLMLILLVSQFVILLGALYEEARQEFVAAESDRFFFHPKFQLNDLMLTLVTACAVMALLSQGVRFGFLELIHLVGIGVAMGVWSLIGIGIVYWKFPWRKKIGLGLIAMTGSLIWAALDDQWITGGPNQSQKFVSWFLLLTAIASFILVMLAMYKFSIPSQASQAKGFSQTAGRRKWFQYLSTGLLLLMGLCFVGSTVNCYISLLRPPKLSQSGRTILPGEPNGFEDFAKAGEEFNGSPILNTSITLYPGKQTRDEITAFSRSFDNVDVGLSRKIQTCIDLSNLGRDRHRYAILDNEIMDKIQNQRSVARALSIKARQEIHDGNYDEALSDGLRCIKMVQCLNDCILVTHLVGIACEGIGSRPIQIAIENATTPKLKEAAKTLGQIDAESSTLEQILTNDQYYFWKLSDWRDRLFFRAYESVLMAPANDQLKQARARRNSIRAQLRTAIALEIYKRDHGAYPGGLFELVPDYLDRVLNDPFPVNSPTKPLRYLTLGDRSTYKLYSVWVNGIDENGEPSPTGNPWKDGDHNFAEIVGEEELETKNRADEYARSLDETQATDEK